MREVKQEPLGPPQKRARTNGDAESSTSVPQPDLNIDFDDTNTKERVITITHTTASDKASFTFNSSVANGLSATCGDLQIRVSNLKLPAAALSNPGINAERARPPPNPVRPPMFGQINPMRARASSAMQPTRSTTLAAATVSTARSTQPNSDARVVVEIVDKRLQMTRSEFPRSARLEEVFRWFATVKGLDYENLRFRRQFSSGSPVEPRKRIGSVLQRYFTVICFDVEDLGDTEEYNPYSEYDSDN